jgi:hypothetical protein
MSRQKLLVGILGSLTILTSDAFGSEVAYRNFSDASKVSISIYSIGIGAQVLNVGVVNEAAAQQFIPNAGGALASVSAILQQTYYLPTPLTVEIRTSNGNLPGAVLGAITQIPMPLQPVGGPEQSLLVNTFDFSTSGVNLVAGTPYFAVFRTDTTPPGTFAFQGNYWLHTMNPNPLSSGHPPIASLTGGSPPWIANDGLYPQEIGLIVNVVPEPMSLLLSLMAITSLCLFRRRQ